MLSESELEKGILCGSRRHLAKAITLAESKLHEDRAKALRLLERLYPPSKTSQRIGISGSPGVGKSTFIEIFGQYFLNKGNKLAVLTIDPSSPRSAGSILGDKTRMAELAQNPSCFIRPTPAGLSLGGVARRTREAILLCEAAGFDTIIIETVGVGQSEHIIDTMVDLFIYLTLPNAGDQLQGIKRGILELTDIIIVTKADGDLINPAKQAALDHEVALHFLHPDNDRISPKVFTCSSIDPSGFEIIYQAVIKMFDELQKTGKLSRKRIFQSKTWYETEIYEQIIDKIMSSEKIKNLLKETEEKIKRFELPAPVAALKVTSTIFEKIPI